MALYDSSNDLNSKYSAVIRDLLWWGLMRHNDIFVFAFSRTEFNEVVGELLHNAQTPTHSINVAFMHLKFTVSLFQKNGSEIIITTHLTLQFRAQ